MAKRLKADDPTPTQEARIPGEGEFKRLLKKLKAEESVISEAKGNMGSAVEQAVAKTNLHADALRVFRKYEKKNPTQCAEFMLHLSTYWEYGKLGEPDNDLLETPAERKRKMKKPEADEEAEIQAEAKKQRRRSNRGETTDGGMRSHQWGADGPARAKAEPLGEGNKAIRGGKVVDLSETEAAGAA